MGGREMEKVEEVEVVEEEVVEEEKEEVKEIEEITDDFSLANRFYYEERDYRKALDAYSKVIESVEDPLLRLRAMYMRAESLVKLKRIEEAIQAFQELADQEVDNHLVESARRRARALRDYYGLEGD